ncbi:MAG: hypothetical protein HYY11_05275 [Candidatus Methylomirabilis oxyfera]|nr:hypothetical protein [Candidatus Methylomirabilis oxyfera]
MKRLFVAGVAVSLLVALTSISWAETTVEDSKSKSSESMGGSGKSKSKSKGTKSTAAPAPQSQQDPCASVKNDPAQYAKCQDAAHPTGLTGRHKGRRGY